MPNFVNLFVAEIGWVAPSAIAMFNLGHYWSLGVEEQFYAFWPWVVSKIKNLKLFLIIFPIVFFLIKVALKFMNAPVEVLAFFHYTRFGCLAIGGLGAYLYFNNHAIVKIFNFKIFEIIAWSVIVLIALNSFHIFSIIDHEIVTILTLIIIFNQVNNPIKLINLENKTFDFLGKISFGLYVYNPLIITFYAKVFDNYLVVENSWYKYVLIYSLVLFSGIFMAHLSYKYLEKPFLRLKHRFVTVESASSNPVNS